MSQNPYQPPIAEPFDPFPVEAGPRLRHSGLGIAAFVIGIASGAIAMASVVAAGVMVHNEPNGFDENNPPIGLMLVGLAIIGSLGMSLLGAGLGIGGLCQSQRNRLFAGLGLAINALIMLGVFGIMALGMVMG